MIKVRNTQNGRTEIIRNVNIVNGIITAEPIRPKKTSRFYNSYPMLRPLGRTDDGLDTMVLVGGWEVITKTRGAKDSTPAPQPAPSSSAEEATDTTPTDAIPATATDLQAEEVQPTAAPVTASAPTLNTGGVTDALAQAFMPVFANVAKNIETNIRASVQQDIDELKAQAKTHVTRLEVSVDKGKPNEVEGVFCADFEDIVKDVAEGFYPYLWGAAGCGKTHTAEQVAKALGLEFYPQTTILFAHDVRGYGDAAGNYVPTSFYEAFKNGGLYFQDEYDRSNPEASIVLNTALANGYYDFPVVGRVKAHPKFRFMAAGNTRMMGADEEYVSGQVQDASSRDRVIYYEMGYDRRVELPVIAQGDETLVNFVEDVRNAIKSCRISHVVSYRETKYMKAREDKKEKALIRSTFKGLESDAIRLIYGSLADKENPWAKAMKKIF